MEALVAIILVNFNGESDTVECLKSLKALEYKNYFVIVVDNHSSKCSVDVLKRARAELAFELIQARDNGGFAAANNIGIKYALEKGADNILLLNNDTIVEPDFLGILVDALKRDKKCGIATGTIYYENDRSKIWCAGGLFDNHTFKVAMRGYGTKGYRLPYEIEEVSFATGCCMCIKVQLIKEIGNLNETYFMYEEDAEFCYRARTNGWEIYYAPKAIIYHKVSASSGHGYKASSLTQYYMVRNKFWFIKQYMKPGYRIYAYIYSLAMYFYYCLKGYMDIRYVFLGMRDFLKNIQGKANGRF